MLLKAAPGGNLLILEVMMLVWLADIFAYFSGRAFGKRKLAPAVSPGKSWEGLYGGLAAALVATLVLGLVRGWGLGDLLQALIGAACVVLISVVGDLTESMFKRQAGLKDSSQLLPGHGGVLDRIDSLTAAVPLFALLLWWAAGVSSESPAALCPGCDGSIGASTLDVVARYPDRYRIFALSGHRRLSELADLCRRFQPVYAAVPDQASADQFGRFAARG